MHFAPSKRARIKKTGTDKGWRGRGRSGTLTLCLREHEMEDSLALPWKGRRRVAYEQVCMCYTLDTNENKHPSGNLHTDDPSSIIHKKWQQPRSPVTDEWISKTWCLHVIGYYSTIRGNEAQTHATTQMNLDDTMSSRSSQSRRPCVTRTVQSRQI